MPVCFTHTHSDNWHIACVFTVGSLLDTIIMLMKEIHAIMAVMNEIYVMIMKVFYTIMEIYTIITIMKEIYSTLPSPPSGSAECFTVTLATNRHAHVRTKVDRQARTYTHTHVYVC